MYEFRVVAPGLDAETIARAEAAAQAAFDSAGVTPMRAAACCFKLEMAERAMDTSSPDVTPLLSTEVEWQAAMAWRGAEIEAAKACYGGDGTGARPDGWNLITPRDREI